ncbi:MAG: phospho-N-acetylmuramoyl-pentapeptide-transferase [Candidatus Desulfofervidaceae bacterium]|nr:phospho-N-acetylmuramoyl-pentapeptide-transferase [Candidatus Desulfofervidaceae bacterium]
MIYHLLYPLHKYWIGFNVFRYITFRTAYAILTALFLSFCLIPWFIHFFRGRHWGKTEKEYEPYSHNGKIGTPTMGGIPILLSVFITVLLWGNLNNGFTWTLFLTCVLFGLIGFVDDCIKIKQKKGKGLSIKTKFGLQIVSALIIGFILFEKLGLSTRLYVPFFKSFTPDIGSIYYLFFVLVVVGASNAVNLTDGLDGLAVGPLGISFGSYLLLAYLAGHIKLAQYLQIAYVPGVGEVAVFCGALLGACLGFLWYNAYPAEIFMGDVGSLSLGATLGTIAVMVKQECLLLLIGGLFVIEALSVIIQVSYFKLTKGKRVFKMSPLHHHFELKGWPEPKIIVRFWIVGIILALTALSTLKLR